MDKERRPLCIRCNREMVIYHLNDAFYFCNGVPNPDNPEDSHPEYLETTKEGEELDSIETTNPKIQELPQNLL